MHLAQFNIAEALAPMEDPSMIDFVANIDRLNTLAEESEGFVWRFTAENEPHAYNVRAYDSNFILVNMSVWASRESLFDYVYNSAHAEIFKRRAEWFQKMPTMHMVLWYVEEGHIPTLEEGKARLQHLQDHGESPFAFSFRSSYSPQDLGS